LAGAAAFFAAGFLAGAAFFAAGFLIAIVGFLVRVDRNTSKHASCGTDIPFRHHSTPGRRVRFRVWPRSLGAQPITRSDIEATTPTTEVESCGSCRELRDAGRVRTADPATHRER
jgi:hypothetical protein